MSNQSGDYRSLFWPLFVIAVFGAIASLILFASHLSLASPEPEMTPPGAADTADGRSSSILFVVVAVYVTAAFFLATVTVGLMRLNVRPRWTLAGIVGIVCLFGAYAIRSPIQSAGVHALGVALIFVVVRYGRPDPKMPPHASQARESPGLARRVLAISLTLAIALAWGTAAITSLSRPSVLDPIDPQVVVWPTRRDRHAGFLPEAVFERVNVQPSLSDEPHAQPSHWYTRWTRSLGIVETGPGGFVFRLARETGNPQRVEIDGFRTFAYDPGAYAVTTEGTLLVAEMASARELRIRHYASTLEPIAEERVSLDVTPIDADWDVEWALQPSGVLGSPPWVLATTDRDTIGLVSLKSDLLPIDRTRLVGGGRLDFVSREGRQLALRAGSRGGKVTVDALGYFSVDGRHLIAPRRRLLPLGLALLATFLLALIAIWTRRSLQSLILARSLEGRISGNQGPAGILRVRTERGTYDVEGTLGPSANSSDQPNVITLLNPEVTLGQASYRHEAIGSLRAKAILVGTRQSTLEDARSLANRWTASALAAGVALSLSAVDYLLLVWF